MSGQVESAGPFFPVYADFILETSEQLSRLERVADELFGSERVPREAKATPTNEAAVSRTLTGLQSLTARSRSLANEFERLVAQTGPAANQSHR